MSIELILIGALSFVASLIGTLSGFGISTIMVPILLLFFPLPITLLFVGIIHWFGNVWKMLLFHSGFSQWKIILWFAGPAVFASFIGATISVTAPEEILLRILGGFLLAYAVFVLLKSEWKLPERKSVAGVGGFVAGFSSGIFGVGGEIRAVFLTALNFPKETYYFTLGAIGLAIDSSRIAGYLGGGARLDGFLLWGLLIFIPISLFGALLARRFVNLIPQKYFRVFIALFLAVAALKFLVFP